MRYPHTTLNTGFAKSSNSPVSLSLSLNQVVPVEKQYPVWENIVTTFTLLWWKRIVWWVEVFDSNDWWTATENKSILTTEVFIAPANPEVDLAQWEYYIDYSTWDVIAKWALPWSVVFKYETDNSVSVTQESETTSRYDYDTEWKLIYEWYAEVWSDEASNVWSVRKYFYLDWDASSSVSKVLFSNWSLAKNVAWSDRETLTYL